jgi:hypothetical protein
MKSLPTLLILISLTSCSLIRPEPVPDVKQVEVVTIEKPAPVYHPPLPNQISPLPVEWRVLTPETMQVYLDDLNAGKAPVDAYYGLTPKGYENLSTNIAEIKRYIRQVLSVIEYYRDLDSEDER